MKIVKASFEVLGNVDGNAILKSIEAAGRTCYKSEDRITEDSATRFVSGIIKSGHESVLEHQSISVRIICDRGISHELVRHRIASFSQESTRFCNYKDKEIEFITPCFWQESNEPAPDPTAPPTSLEWWKLAMLQSEVFYKKMLSDGATPQEARSILPNSLKTELVMTANLREWRHFFKLRALGTNGKPHPQMLEITIPMLAKFKELLPAVFSDLVIK